MSSSAESRIQFTYSGYTTDVSKFEKQLVHRIALISTTSLLSSLGLRVCNILSATGELPMKIVMVYLLSLVRMNEAML